MRRVGSQSGLTLLDVMVGIALLGIGAAGILAVEMAIVSANQEARLLEQATRLAEERMERLVYDATIQTHGSESIDGHGCRGIGCTQQGTIFQRTWAVGPGSPTSLAVSVSWTDRDGRTRQVVLHGLR